MATEEEEDDLEALRIAVLASMKPKVEEKAKTPVSDDEEDPELAALRAAALKTKGQNSTTAPLPTPTLPTFDVNAQFPGKVSQYQRFPFGRGRGRGRSQYGIGRAGLPVGSFRGEKSASNLIVINTVSEDGKDGALSKGQLPNKRETSAGNVFLRPQDKWAGSLSDSNSAASTPTRSKVPNKFSRFDSSGTDSDSDSDNDLSSPEDDGNKSSDEEEDILNLKEDTNAGSFTDDDSANFIDDKNVKNDDDAAKFTIAVAEIPVPSAPKSDNGNKIPHGCDDSKPTDKKNRSPSPVKENLQTIKANHGNTDAMSRILGRKIHQTELFNAENITLALSKVNSSEVVSPVKVNSTSSAVNLVSIPPNNRSVKDRLGSGPVLSIPVIQSNPDETLISPSKLEDIEKKVDLDSMTPEERKLFELRRRKFMEIMEVQDLKKTVSLKGIVPTKKSKKDLPKQYRHRRNRSRSDSRSPSGKVSSSHRKRERRKHKEGEPTLKTKVSQPVSNDSKPSRKQTVSINAESDSEIKTAPLTDTDSSDSDAEPWRFQHTGKAGKQDRRSGKSTGSVFERKAEDLNRERRQRRNIERTIKRETDRETTRVTSPSHKSNSVYKAPGRLSRSSSERRKARFVQETSIQKLDKNSSDKKRSVEKTVKKSIVSVGRSEKKRIVEKSEQKTSKEKSTVENKEKKSSMEKSDAKSSMEKTDKKRSRIVENTDKKSIKTVASCLIKLNNDSTTNRNKFDRQKSDKLSESESSSDSMSDTSSYSSSEDEEDKKRDARSIIVSLRNKEGNAPDFSVASKPPERIEEKKKSEGRASPVVNITFNSERTEIKTSLSSKDHGSIHRRLGLPVSSRHSSESRHSPKKPKRTRKVIEESPERQPTKTGISKSDISVHSRLRRETTTVHDSNGAKIRRLVKTDSRDLIIRDRSKSASDILIKAETSPELKTVHRMKRKSTGGTKSDFSKKIKLNDSEEENPKPRSTSVSNHSKGKDQTKDEITLDEKIRRINEKNQAILRRRQEIMEDKKKYG